MTMLVLLALVFLLPTLGMTLTHRSHHTTQPHAHAVPVSRALYSSPTGVLEQVFVPEDQIRSYMAVNRAKVHSSAPTVGGYTVTIHNR